MSSFRNMLCSNVVDITVAHAKKYRMLSIDLQESDLIAALPQVMALLHEDECGTALTASNVGDLKVIRHHVDRAWVALVKRR